MWYLQFIEKIWYIAFPCYQTAGTDHVTVAIGRDYSDVAPARGSLRSAGSHKTTHQVDVVPV